MAVDFEDKSELAMVWQTGSSIDTDNDLLPDGWEVKNGLDPFVADDINSDMDGDGLILLKEMIYDTDPTEADTDSDGTSDGAEASSGGYPDDASDDGLPPLADEVCELRLTVGDWSGSHSERYNLVLTEVGGTAPFVIHHQGPEFGVVTSDVYKQFRPGKRYEVKIVWLGCNSIGVNCGFPDYDYVAGIEAVSIPAGVIFEIEDPEGILGTHSATFDPVGCTWVDPFYAEGKVAYVNLIKVDFLSDADQKYGWDSFSSTVPWKSVKVGDTDKCVAEIGPEEKANRVYFKSLQPGNVTVSPMQASGSPQDVTLSGVAEGESQVWSRWDSVDGVDLSQLSVAAYQQDEYTLAVCVVNEENDDVQVISLGSGGEPNQICVSAGANGFRDTPDIDIGGDDEISGNDITAGKNGICETAANNTNIISTDPYSASALQDYLNNTVYNQAVVRWTNVVKLSPKTVNFDLDRDGYIDATPIGSFLWTDEEYAVINQCNPGGYNKVVFIVNNPDQSYCGLSGGGVDYAFVYPDVSSNEIITTAHELGHAAFSLDDLQTTDHNNLMYYSDQYNGTKLREGQWSTIQSKKPPE